MDTSEAFEVLKTLAISVENLISNVNNAIIEQSKSADNISKNITSAFTYINSIAEKMVDSEGKTENLKDFLAQTTKLNQKYEKQSDKISSIVNELSKVMFEVTNALNQYELK